MKIVAHKGHHVSVPENTMLAFQAAIDIGFDAIEFDVQASTDGALVVFHDYELDRMTDRSGIVRHQTRASLLDTRISDNRNFYKIPLLEEVLDLDGIEFELEVKTLDRTAISSILKAVERRSLWSAVEFTSSFHLALAQIRMEAPWAKIGLFCRLRHPSVSRYAHQLITTDECSLIGATTLHIPAHDLNESWVDICRARGLLVHAANADDGILVHRVKELGADQISTNSCLDAVAALQ